MTARRWLKPSEVTAPGAYWIWDGLRVYCYEIEQRPNGMLYLFDHLVERFASDFGFLPILESRPEAPKE